MESIIFYITQTAIQSTDVRAHAKVMISVKDDQQKPEDE